MVKKVFKVGLIGYSEGDGHPYSFAAIINGYDKQRMELSPYPVIADYLSKHDELEFGVGNFHVSHVWAQDRKIAEDIASCTNIDHVVNNYEDFPSDVKAVIIARDDAESHYKIASYFLERGVTVFIDKPLTRNLDELDYFKPYLENGQLMSCSGFRYYPLIRNNYNNELKSDHVLFSHSVSIIDWYRYGIHVLEGITPIMGADIDWVQNIGEEGNEIVRISYKNGKYALIQVNNHIGFVLRSSFYTNQNRHFTINYNDNFSCFRGLLWKFYQMFMEKIPVIPAEETITLMKALYAAELSRKRGGQKIHLTDLGVVVH
jgi:hypothetical protein